MFVCKHQHEPYRLLSLSRPSYNQFTVDAHMAHSGLRIESRCVHNCTRYFLFNYQTSNTLFVTAMWPNVRTLITCSYLVNKNDSPTLYNDYRSPLAMTFILLVQFLLIFFFPLAKPVHCVLNFLEIIKMPHICTMPV